MHYLVYVPLLFSALFSVLAPVVGRPLPPAVATWLLSVGGPSDGKPHAVRWQHSDRLDRRRLPPVR